MCITQTIDCSHQQGPCDENGANGTIFTQTTCFEINPNNMSGAQYCMWSNGNNVTPCDCEITTTSISFALINNVGPPYETCTYTGGLATTIGNILNGSSSGSFVIDFNTDCEKFPRYWRIDISPDGNGGINLNFH